MLNPTLKLFEWACAAREKVRGGESDSSLVSFEHAVPRRTDAQDVITSSTPGFSHWRSRRIIFARASAALFAILVPFPPLKLIRLRSPERSPQSKSNRRTTAHASIEKRSRLRLLCSGPSSIVAMPLLR